MNPMPQPKGITDLLAHFAEDVPFAAREAKHLGGKLWHIAVTSDRVFMWIEYEVHSRGRLRTKRSQLWIDGKQVERAKGYDHLVQIFINPDDPESGESEFSPVDPAAAPADIRGPYDMLTAKLGHVGAPTIQRSGLRWQIRLDSARVSLRLAFIGGGTDHRRPGRVAPVRMDADNPVSLTLDGRDMTDKVMGSLERALGLIAGHLAAPHPGTVAGDPTTPGIANSVRVRKQTVIRN